MEINILEHMQNKSNTHIIHIIFKRIKSICVLKYFTKNEHIIVILPNQVLPYTDRISEQISLNKRLQCTPWCQITLEPYAVW